MGTANLLSPLSLLSTPCMQQSAQLEELLKDLVRQNPDAPLEEQRLTPASHTVSVPVPGTLESSASLSDLDRIGMGVRVTQTMRATEVSVKGGQPSTPGASATQTVSTHQEMQGLLMHGCDWPGHTGSRCGWVRGLL